MRMRSKMGKRMRMGVRTAQEEENEDGGEDGGEGGDETDLDDEDGYDTIIPDRGDTTGNQSPYSHTKRPSELLVDRSLVAAHKLVECTSHPSSALRAGQQQDGCPIAAIAARLAGFCRTTGDGPEASADEAIESFRGNPLSDITGDLEGVLASVPVSASKDGVSKKLTEVVALEEALFRVQMESVEAKEDAGNVCHRPEAVSSRSDIDTPSSKSVPIRENLTPAPPSTFPPNTSPVKPLLDLDPYLESHKGPLEHRFWIYNQWKLNFDSEEGGMEKFKKANQRLLEQPAEFVKGLDTIVGVADVPHFTRSHGMPSIAAAYFPTVQRQSNKTEVIEDMQGIMKDTFIAYYRANQSRKPQWILFYRDEVSKDHFQRVFASEIKAVKRVCQSLEQKYNPKITITVMTKRHKTKIFVDKPGTNNADKSGNAMPGTVVDTTITHPFESDLDFLMSHAGILGTSCPAHYYVLLDENGLSGDVMHQFTYRPCYVYTRAARSVSLVPPTYYAHLLIYRARLRVLLKDRGAQESRAGDGWESDGG
ncbi:Piwi-domain-containing protein [Gonapodya prolifera JEL478]|uniref:Piwi-domain-containing protein n=1 Tax=Gonapodya prolifera (strain JEL478) TaxID=1344416 RepID=A0A138ZY69_GONPJ|nr:Piwi-domain-containing protein [Gonapodya prolifera JEL478]|eukprot:KXS09448.1 Piwi-domain-containing protein [Gonapodya prolifera JEL478]